MRAVVAWVVATVALLAPLAPVAAAPPEDVAAYCRATYPQIQFQVRCLNVENAAAERVSRSGASADRDALNRCLTVSPSWAAMEACLAQSARGVPMGGVPGVVSPPSAALTPAAGLEPAGPSAGEPTGAAAGPPPAPEPSVAGGPGGSTVVLGPQVVPPTAVAENRPTRPISEADADRHLRGVLERAGTPAARCTKKQYGPGWVIICE
jgi:hypothetical protein